MALFSELVTLISMNLTISLINMGLPAGSFPITAVSLGSPILVTSPAHGVPPPRAGDPPSRVVHGVISDVGGELEANGPWILQPVDPDTFALYAIDAQGKITPSVGTNPYTTGGVIKFGLAGWGILLGRHFLDLNESVVSPRVVFIPVDEPAWGFEPYGGIGTPTASPPERGTPEQQAQKLQPQLATAYPTFDVYITGAAVPPSPSFGDFDAAVFIRDTLYSVMFNASGAPRATVLGGTWPSQKKDAGTKIQRGQQWLGRVRFQQPIVVPPRAYVPPGTSLVLTVDPVNPGSGDDTVITITAST